MTVVPIDARRITDWDGFHDVFAKAFGFPAFYGRNMNAWIDCMSCVDAPELGMTTVHVQDGEVCVIRLTNAAGFPSRCPEVYAALTECTVVVNWRNLEAGDETMLALAFHD